MAVYLYIAGYHLLDSRDTQYDHKVTCHVLMIPACYYRNCRRNFNNKLHGNSTILCYEAIIGIPAHEVVRYIERC